MADWRGVLSVVFAILMLAMHLADGAPIMIRNRLINAANQTYDYVVIGCGIAGLVVTMRLTEDPNVSVLCLEAGPFDHYETTIQYPVYIGQQPYGFYDWRMNTAPQMQLDGRSRQIPAGKGVGGGSLINGMLWNRGNQDDFDAWAQFGNPGWAWNDLLPYFEKSETYTPIYYDGQDSQPVDFFAVNHGFSGPVNVSYPQYYWNQSENYFQALNGLGIPTAFDPNDGNSVGIFYIPSDVDPINQTRSDSRRAYYDPYSSRTNLNILDNSQVIRILFGNDTTSLGYRNNVTSTVSHAYGVEYSNNATAQRQMVFASREVIIAAGALHSPKLLQLSGIGPSALLQSLGLSILQDLPGVGNNLQDHGMIHLDYPYRNPNYTTPYTYQFNATFNDECEEQYISSRTGPWTGRPSTAIAFPSLPHITNQTFTYQLIQAARQMDRYHPAAYDTTLKRGYEMQHASTLSRLSLNTTPAYEHLNNNAGGQDLALMHPLSRGTVTITSTDPFVPPSVDPRWLVNPFDFQVMLAAMRFNQRILHTPSIQQLMPTYAHIPENATDGELAAILRSNIGTEFHYSGTCSMMPRELGGVVGPNLVVYGTDNLRVVDTSVFPLIPAAHLQAVVYAVAEKAADIIKGVPPGVSTPSPLSSPFMAWLRGILHLGRPAN